jgi:hypothetical protein
MTNKTEEKLSIYKGIYERQKIDTSMGSKRFFARKTEEGPLFLIFFG